MEKTGLILVAENLYHKIYWNASQFILECIWTTPLKISETDFQQCFLEFTIELIRYKPHYLLINVKKSQNMLNQMDKSVITENNQYEGSEYLKKVAWVVSSDIFSQISHELFLSEIIQDHYEFQFFDNDEKAAKWLLNLQE